MSSSEWNEEDIRDEIAVLFSVQEGNPNLQLVADRVSYAVQAYLTYACDEKSLSERLSLVLDRLLDIKHSPDRQRAITRALKRCLEGRVQEDSPYKVIASPPQYQFANYEDASAYDAASCNDEPYKPQGKATMSVPTTHHREYSPDTFPAKRVKRLRKEANDSENEYKPTLSNRPRGMKKAKSFVKYFQKEQAEYFEDRNTTRIRADWQHLTYLAMPIALSQKYPNLHNLWREFKEEGHHIKDLNPKDSEVMDKLCGLLQGAFGRAGLSTLVQNMKAIRTKGTRTKARHDDTQGGGTPWIIQNFTQMLFESGQSLANVQLQRIHNWVVIILVHNVQKACFKILQDETKHDCRQLRAWLDQTLNVDEHTMGNKNANHTSYTNRLRARIEKITTRYLADHATVGCNSLFSRHSAIMGKRLDMLITHLGGSGVLLLLPDGVSKCLRASRDELVEGFIQKLVANAPYLSQIGKALTFNVMLPFLKGHLPVCELYDRVQNISIDESLKQTVGWRDGEDLLSLITKKRAGALSGST